MSKSKDYTAYIDRMLDTVKPVYHYKRTFIEHCREDHPRISTGILSFDKLLNGGLTDELYIMAAETSSGKSAFLMSIAQHIAENGIDVLYFALEMGKDELIARGISSISYEHHRQSPSVEPLSAGKILYWSYDDIIKDFTRTRYSSYEKFSDEYFMRYGGKLHIIEGGLTGLTVRDIANISSKFKAKSNKPVVVFVDYLQIIRADPEDRSQADRKNKIDVSVTTLKALASQIGMPVLTISSISRVGYGSKVTTSSFKESGDTEYTGGVLLGWSWTGVTDQKDPSQIEEEKDKCRERQYRRMELEILKYRNGERDCSVHLKYYPAYNYFEEDNDADHSSKSTKGTDDEPKF